MGPNTTYSDLSLLHPEFLGPCRRLHQFLIDSYETGRTKCRFEIFETFRSPVRQAYLITKGTTKAGPFQSAHQFGLACDFVPYLSKADAERFGAIRPGWCWNEIPEEEWVFLKQAAVKHGLDAPITWDRPHIESPLWKKWKKVVL